MKRHVWMGHAGHFICGHLCRFRLNTYVNGYIVSTVGELHYESDPPHSPARPLGADPDSFYETMVFPAKAGTHACCPFVQDSGRNLDSRRYHTSAQAAEGHAAMLKKWSSRRPPSKKA
jgi:hypothetical protein